MFSVIFYKRNKVVFQKDFDTQQEAEDFINLEPHEYNCEYEIFNKETEDVVDEGEIEGEDDINEGERNMMFPDEECEEGFDVDDFYDKD